MNHSERTFKSTKTLLSHTGHLNPLVIVSCSWLTMKNVLYIVPKCVSNNCFSGGSSQSKFPTDLQLTQQQTEVIGASAPPTRFKFRVSTHAFT